MKRIEKKPPVVSPTFSSWPYEDFKQFKNFAKDEAGDIYWVAVKLLMERNQELQRIKAMFMEPQEQEQEQEKPQLNTLGE